MTTRTTNVTADAWYFNDGAVNYGNGMGPQMYCGHTSAGSLTGTNRFAIKIPRGSLFTGVPSSAAITAFNVKLRVKSGCDGMGATVRFFLEKATTALTENAYTVDCGVSAAYAASTEWPGPTRVTTNRASYSGSPAVGDWITVNALSLGRDWFANTDASLTLVGIAALADLSGYDEATAARRIALWTAQSASVPYVELTYGGNSPPNKPTNPAFTVSTDGTALTVTTKYTDPEGDTSTQFEALWVPDPT